MDAADVRYQVDRVLQVTCSCGRKATATLLTVTVPPNPPLITKWFRAPAHWFVALTGDLKRIGDDEVIPGPFVRCPSCLRLSPPGDRTKGPLATAAENRPENFDLLDAQARWDVDKALGILDWSGDPEE